jgi:regulator of RNase E activity RraA
VRAGEDAKPGDVIVVELGGMVDKATFMGDVTGRGIRAAGVTGVVIDGGLRDLSEFMPMREFPCPTRARTRDKKEGVVPR